MSQPQFIVLEAINAAGKTTQFRLLQEKLTQAGYNVLSYHFHQRGRATGQLIEHKFLHQKSTRRSFSRREQALLYIQDFYSRAEDLREHHKRNKNKNIVLADRFYTSTLAYQAIGLSGHQRREMLAWIKWLCEEGEPRLPKPDQVILLDTPVAISLQHLAKAKPSQNDYFENKQRLQALRRSYLRVAKEEKWTVINSADDQGRQRPPEAIHKDIWKAINR